MIYYASSERREERLQEHRCWLQASRMFQLEVATRLHTFLLFSSLPFIAYFYRTYAENDGYDKEEDTADNASSYRFVLDSSWNWEFHHITCSIICRRIGKHLKVISFTSDQIFHCTKNPFLS